MRRAAFVVLVLLGTSRLAVAQTAAVRLTLDEAIARGIEASYRLEELSARQEAARAIEDQRDAAKRPQIAAFASYARTNHTDEISLPDASGGVRVIYPDVPNNTQSRIDLQWPIYTGGRLGALSRAAGAEAEALGQDREAARADLKLEITRAFWAVVTARAAVDVVRQALERTSAHLEDVRSQLRVGLVPPSDVLSTEAQHAHQRMLGIEADNIVLTTTAELKRLVGVDQDAAIELISPAAQPLTPVVADARENRPERKSLLFRIAAANERVAAASAGNLPQLNAIAGYDMARPNLRIFPIQEKWRSSWDIGVNVHWSLFDGGRVRAETAEAAANRRATQARLRDFDADLERDVRQRTADMASAAASIEAGEAGVRAAAETRRVLAERFSAGVATNLDVLDAQAALLRAELDLTRARANAELARARLDRTVGR